MNSRTAESVDYKGSTLRFPWGTASRLDVWVAAYGPKALALAGEVGDGFILQLADPDIVAWSIKAVRAAAAAAGRDPAGVKICVAAPAYVTDGSAESLAHGRDQCRWFGGMVGNHVADIVERYGAGGAAVPQALTDYIAGRQGYDYNEHGRAGNEHTTFVPDSIVDRFCLIGTVDEQIARLKELEGLGVDQFSIYLQHDAKEPTLAAYGNHVMPAVREHVASRRQSMSVTGTPLGDVRRASLLLLAVMWEAYKLVGPERGGKLFGRAVLPKSADSAMPHVWDMVTRLFRSEQRGSSRTILETVLAGGWFTFRIALTGLAARRRSIGMGLAIFMAKFKLVERGLLPLDHRVTDRSADRARHRSWSAGVAGSRSEGSTWQTMDVGRGDRRRSWRSSRSRSVG